MCRAPVRGEDRIGAPTMRTTWRKGRLVRCVAKTGRRDTCSMSAPRRGRDSHLDLRSSIFGYMDLPPIVLELPILGDHVNGADDVRVERVEAGRNPVPQDGPTPTW